MGIMLTELESALNNFIEIYHKYSMAKGNVHALYRDDLKRLLEAECPQYIKVRRAGHGLVLCLALMMPQLNGHSSAFLRFLHSASLFNFDRKRMQTPGSKSWISIKIMQSTSRNS